MFDSHCHLNFKAFEGKVKQVIDEAKAVGVKYLVIPATNVETSKKAVEIACRFKNVYAAVGIHPHHVKEYQNKSKDFKKDLKLIENLLKNEKVVAVGEVGLDTYIYQKTKYPNYQIDKEFINLQKIIFKKQIALAKKYNKALIIHNRQAKNHLLDLLTKNRSLINFKKTVFHCCEPEEELLTFAKDKGIFIGVDGDITYNRKKQEFVKKVPLELLVLETDSPFLLPQSLKEKKQYPNQPKNLPLITNFIANLYHCPKEKLAEITTVNAKRLFGLN